MTRWEYNLSNRLTRVIYHDGSCACYTYYDNGEKGSEHRCDQQGNLLPKTSYVYDSLKRLTDQYDYDFDGETVLKHAHYEYYDSGLKSRDQIFGPGPADTETLELETRYYYDELKRLIKTVTDPDGYNITVDKQDRQTGTDTVFQNRYLSLISKRIYLYLIVSLSQIRGPILHRLQ